MEVPGRPKAPVKRIMKRYVGIGGGLASITKHGIADRKYLDTSAGGGRITGSVTGTSALRDKNPIRR